MTERDLNILDIFIEPSFIYTHYQAPYIKAHSTQSTSFETINIKAKVKQPKNGHTCHTMPSCTKNLQPCRVAGVGRLSAGAKNAINSFVKRVFANLQHKNAFYRV